MAAPQIFGGKTLRGPNVNMHGTIEIDGRTRNPEIREDEEQTVKLQETIELLVAAGYFRARIKSLSPFDKIIGGMTWCITTCNIDVDVDLLFQENLIIGQKIALTEKLVEVLPKMKCPHRLEPHQIQGLDCIHIFPVVQWLVKKALEFREENQQLIRTLSISQYDKTYYHPSDREFNENKHVPVATIAASHAKLAPRRRYKQRSIKWKTDEKTRIQLTLLEYGSHGAVTGVTGCSGEESGDASESQERLEKMMKTMSATEGKRVTSKMLGSMVSDHTDDLVQIIHDFALRQSEWESTGIDFQEKVIKDIEKDLKIKKNELESVEGLLDTQQAQCHEIAAKIKELEEHGQRLDRDIGDLSSQHEGLDTDLLRKFQDMINENESLKKEEQTFKSECKSKVAEINAKIASLELELVEGVKDERNELINKQFDADTAKLAKIRMMLAKKNRELVSIQRKIDEVPTRAELSQYQKRFLELYNQMGVKHKETKNYYALYNMLSDVKACREREANLLNSIHDTFEQAMAGNQSIKAQFLKQFEQILDDVKARLGKAEKRLQEEKIKKDTLTNQCSQFVEQQRLYFKAVNDFQDECRKNEKLTTRLHKLEVP